MIKPNYKAGDIVFCILQGKLLLYKVVKIVRGREYDIDAYNITNKDNCYKVSIAERWIGADEEVHHRFEDRIYDPYFTRGFTT